MTTKKCTKCGRELPLDEFYSSKRAKDGLKSECKECSKRYNTGRKIAKYTPRELMKELSKRGYYGILCYDEVKEETIEHDGHKGIFKYVNTIKIDITNF